MRHLRNMTNSEVIIQSKKTLDVSGQWVISDHLIYSCDSALANNARTFCFVWA
jgi:hypothetical protein